MSTLFKKGFRATVLVGSMIMANECVNTIFPAARGLTKIATSLAAITIFGAGADMGCKYALQVLESASDKMKGC